MIEIQGACLCRRTSYLVTGRAIKFYACFCNLCQKASGSSNAFNIFLDPISFEVSDPESLLRQFEMSSDTFFNKAFCSNCGSAMPCEAKSGDFVIVPAGSIKSNLPIAPTSKIHWEDRPKWYRAPDSLNTEART